MKKIAETSKIKKSTSKTSKRKRILLAVLIVMFVLPLLTLGMSLLGFAIWAGGQRVDPGLLPTASALPTFYDSAGERIEPSADAYVMDGEAPEQLKNAFVATEDKRFYTHRGYDPVRICGAIVKNLKSGAVKEGASTITQQLVKNTHLSNERSLKRKLKEIALARDLEKRYSKDSILNMYLSVIYFGNGAYGVKSAARRFFDADIENLTLAQSATLAGIVKNPSGYSPLNKPDACLKRRNLVLSLMLEQGYISEKEYSAAKAEPLNVKQNSSADLLGAAQYIALAKKQVCDELGITTYQLDNSGLKIYTYLDRNVQQMLERERKNPLNFESDKIAEAAVVIDNKTGATIGISCTYPYQISRQTGSVLKPLAVYAPALDSHIISLATPIVDEKVNFGGFSPRNYGDVYYGETTVQEAIKKSMNSVSVKVLDYLGVEKSAQYLQKFGFSLKDSDKNYSLALGSLSLSPAQVAGAYAAFARGGTALEGGYVKYVVKDGKKFQFQCETSEIVAPATAALMSAALADSVRDGTAKTLSALPFEVAAKTGTAEGADGKNSDAWVASYNDDATVVVWHGSDEGMTERGGGYPTRHAKAIWENLVQKYAFKKNIDLSAAVKLDVDSYSSSALKRVVLANKNTPLEYRKTAYFDISYLPDNALGLFDSAPNCPLDITVREGHVELKFDSSKIYGYNLFRTDIFGKALILSCDGDGNEVCLNDTPIGFGNIVEYELICYVKCNPGASSATLKQIYFEPGYAA